MVLPKIAVSQMSSLPGDLDHNIRAVCKAIHDAARADACVVIFPECALTGYMFETRDETERAAVALNDPRLLPLQQAVTDTGCHAVIGLLERDGDAVFNSAAVLAPSGQAGLYRKQHLPQMGADRFVTPGDGGRPRVFDIGLLKIGVMICFDLRFPECARELALDGADVIAMPTNWPLTASMLANDMLRVRAIENFVYMAVADRADAEFGKRFYGGSRIVSPKGEVLASSTLADALVVAEVDVEQARVKELFFAEMGYGISIFDSRRPELYGRLVDNIETR